jgi:hypothetical protein
MNVFSSTELRTESVKVYNLVQSKTPAIIKHRDRPTMVLIDKETLEKALNTGDSSTIIADLTF